MKNKGVSILSGLVVVFGLYAYFGEYKREAQETERRESDSKIVTLKKEQIWKMTFDKGGATQIVLEKGTDGWSLTQPIKDQADNENAESLLDQIAGEKAVDVIESQSGIKWEDYGLQAPLGTITLETNAGEKQSYSVSTRKNFEGLVFLRRDQEPKVLTSSGLWTDFLTKTVDSYRNLKIFRSQISKVDGIKLQNSKGRIELQNKNAQWESVLHPEWKMDQNAIREILTQVSLAKGTGLIDKKPVGQPRMNLELMMGQEKWTGAFYENSVVSNPPGLNISITPQTLEKLPTLELVGLRDKTVPFKFQRDLVQKMNVKSPLKSFVLVKKDSKWALENPDDKVVVSSEKADDVVERLHRFEVYKYLTSKVGSAEMPWEIHLMDEQGKTVFRMNWSDFKQHEAFARTNVTPEVFQMDDAQINRLMLGEIVKLKSEVEASTSSQEKQ